MKNTQLSRADDNPVALAADPAACALSVQQVLGQVSLIQQVMKAAMRDGEHFGKIPGCGDKPTLLKPGAEKLCLTFRLAPTYEVEEKIGEHGHREYRVTCALTSILNGAFIGQGVGVCTTMEAKYRYRTGKGEPTDQPVPRAYWDVRQEDPRKAQELIGGKGFMPLKVEGKGWMIAKGGEKVEHDNPADHYNTVLKMGKKRALVDAVLTATAASDIFTQDLEDITANLAARISPDLVVVGGGGKASSPGKSGDAPAGSVASGSDESRGTSQSATTDQSGDQVELTEAEAWDTEIHFGKNRGKTLRSLTENQRDYYFDKWPKETRGDSAADRRLLLAIRVLAPLPGDFSPTDEEPPVDFRMVRVHFGKNQGLMLHELTPQQVHWYETDWMPKKEVNGSASVEDLALVNALKAYRNWRAGQAPDPQ